MLYLGLTDSAGHDFGWMGDEYRKACRQSLDEVQRLTERFMEEYTIIFTADHGGHGRSHGSLDKEDMLIPLVCIGSCFQPGAVLEQPGICDIAPTVTQLLGLPAAREWEGKSRYAEQTQIRAADEIFLLPMLPGLFCQLSDQVKLCGLSG